jgi:molybdopterin molybdotransferase
MSSALLSYEEAAALVADKARGLARQPSVECVELGAAAGRVLAQPLCADSDQPPFTRSTRDGFACRAAEASSHAFLRIAGATRAGDSPAEALPPGAALEIMTGAPVPEGADAVVMIEHVEVSDGQVRLLPPRTAKEGDNLVASGAQAREGEELAPVGARLTFAQIALAATCGYATVEIFARPRVAILTTGDELVPVGSVPGPGQIRNSNAPMLAAMVEAAGGDARVLPTAHDDAASLDAALASAAEADMLLISGGVSAGKFDLVEPALARLGAEFHFTGIRMQPGKPLVFGELQRMPESFSRASGRAQALPFFGLPGNPVSSAVTFLLFAAPVLRALGGNAGAGPRFALARLAAHTGKGAKPGLTRFLPAFCTFSAKTDGLPEVTLVGWQGSGDLAALARSNCFLVIPEDTGGFEPGEIVRILLP